MSELIIKKENKVLSRLPLGETEVLIGRASSCHVVLNDPLVSWNHAKIVYAYGGHLVEDLESTNGVLINGRKINKRQMIKHGEVIKIGTHDLFIEKDIHEKYNLNPEKTVSFGFSPQVQTRHVRLQLRIITGSEAGICKEIRSLPHHMVDKVKNTYTVISQVDEGYYLYGTHCMLNGCNLISAGSVLKDQDVIQINDVQMRFLVG